MEAELASIPILELPTDKPRVNQNISRIKQFAVKSSASLPLHFSSTLTTALKALGQQEDSTLFMTLLATFNVLLYRYTKQEDILVGSPIIIHKVEQEAKIEGINTLVLRTDLSSNLSFKELLARVRQITLAAYAHSDLPFEQLIKTLELEENISYNLPFQVMFSLEGVPVLEDKKGTRTQVDLALSLHETAEGLKGYLDYNRNLFE